MPIVTGQLVSGQFVAGQMVVGRFVGSPESGVLDPGEAALRETLADVGLTSAATVVSHLDGSLTATLGAVSLDASATVETPPPPAGETIRFAMPAADWDVSVAAFRAGESGSNYLGAFVAIVGDGMADHAWYFTHDGFGWDPQPYNASLTGFTMHAVDLAAGDVTDDDVATALRAAIDGEGLYDDVAGTGANVEVTGDIDADACFTGEDTPGASGAWGCREDDIGAGGFDGNPLAEPLHAFSTFTAGPALITALGTRVVDAGDPIRLAVYEGGTAASGGSSTVNPADLDDTDLLSEAVLTGSGTGWVCQPLEPGQVTEIADNTPVQYVAKGEATDTNGSFRAMGNLGDNDLAAQQLAVLDLDPDPAITYPATLDANEPTASFSLVLMIAFEYRVAPHRGDAGGITLTVL